MNANVETVQRMYAAFDRGDIPGVLSELDESIVWTLFGDPASNPLAGPRRGPAEVGGFFAELGGTLDQFKLDRQVWIADEQRVVALGDFSAVIRANGQPLHTRFAHVWTFNAAGKPVAFEDFVDTEAFCKAWAVQAATAH